MLKRLIVVALACGTLAGCATQGGIDKDGKRYGVTEGTFRGRWWSYYERGSSYNAGEFYQQAEADLREAIRGRSVDTWSARTYGLHFVEYFPNRELGVACFHLGRLDDAETYLNTSLRQIDTERAHHYLDLVKKERIAKGELKNDTPPALGASVIDGAVLASREIPLNIRATDNLGVETVKVNGQPLHQRGSALEVAFQQDLVLDEGMHTIAIDANNLGGIASSQSITLNVDISGPSIGIFEPPSDLVTDAVTVKLRGGAADATGLAAVKLDDKVLADAKGAREASFESELALKDGANQFVIIATDTAGNETRSAVSVYKGTRDKTAAFLMGLPDRLLEPLRFAHVRFSAPPIMLPGLANRVKPAVATAGGAASPIEIELKYPKEDTDSHKSEVRVTGRIVTENKVAGLEFNGQKYAVLAAPVVEFSKRIVLAQGENPIRIAATDDQGHAANKEVKVVGQPVTLDTPDSKMSVSVMAFGGAAEESLRQSLRAQTESRLIDRKRFDMVDRQRLAEVLQEQQLSAALADPDRAIQLGKVIPANVFLVGEVIDRGKALEVYTRVVSTETSEIVGKFDIHIDDKSDADKMKFGVDAIAEGMTKSYPRVTGDTVKVDGKNLVFNFGKEEGVQPGMYVLIVHQEDPVKDDKTGEILVEGDYQKLGKAAVRTVSEKACKAERVKQEGDAKLEAGMPAVTM
ncbi:MAG: hypothetical protein HZB26_09815 [Candidatus Hydrogenedentes bacterium]|nr:hypothetical protein [Candidatus Hydrogenedentota bacterium]